jgi:hypothetical protein
MFCSAGPSAAGHHIFLQILAEKGSLQYSTVHEQTRFQLHVSKPFTSAVRLCLVCLLQTRNLVFNNGETVEIMLRVVQFDEKDLRPALFH